MVTDPFMDPMPPSYRNHQVGFTFRNRAAFTFLPTWIHLHLSLAMLFTRNICEKNITSDHRPQSTEHLPATASRFPPSSRHHREEESLLTVHRGEGTLLNRNTEPNTPNTPRTIWVIREPSALGMQVPKKKKSKSTLACATTDGHLPSIFLRVHRDPADPPEAKGGLRERAPGQHLQAQLCLGPGPPAAPSPLPSSGHARGPARDR